MKKLLLILSVLLFASTAWARPVRRTYCGTPCYASSSGIQTLNSSGEVSYIEPTANTGAARCTALQEAITAAGTNGTIVLDQALGTVICSSTLTLLSGQALVGKGMPTIQSNGLAHGTPLITISASNITLDSLKVQSNSTCIGLHSATPTTINNLTIRDVEATVTDTDANALMFSQIHGGGNAEHLVTANIYNSRFVGGTIAGFGSFASLQTGSLMNFYDSYIYGATDGYLHKNSAGTSTGVTNVFGGQAYSVLDACTSGGTGNVMNLYGAYCYGDQADVYADDGTVNLYGVMARYDYIVGNGINQSVDHSVIGTQTISGANTVGGRTTTAGLTNSGTEIRSRTTQSITAVGNTILSTTRSMLLDPNGNYTMTSAPTIANGTAGQELCLTAGNAEANTVTVQDQGTLASSNLQLGATSRVIGAMDMLCLEFDGTDWVEVSYANN